MELKLDMLVLLITGIRKIVAKQSGSTVQRLDVEMLRYTNIDIADNKLQFGWPRNSDNVAARKLSAKLLNW